MNGTRDNNVRQDKPDSERHVSHAFSHIWNLEQQNMKVEGGS
jgi:hypothetical protein